MGTNKEVIINKDNFDDLICDLMWQTEDLLTYYKFLKYNNTVETFTTSLDILTYRKETVDNELKIIINNNSYSNLKLKNEYVINDPTTVMKTRLLWEDGQGQVSSFWTIHPIF